jgi:hypothetical protein
MTDYCTQIDELEVLITKINNISIDDTTKTFLGFPILELDEEYDADVEDNNVHLPDDISNQYIQLPDEICQNLIDNILYHKMTQLNLNGEYQKTDYDVLLKIHEIATSYLNSITVENHRKAIQNLDKEMIHRIYLYLDTVLKNVSFDVENSTYYDFDNYTKKLLELLYILINKIREFINIKNEVDADSYVKRLDRVMIMLNNMCNIIFYILERYPLFME